MTTMQAPPAPLPTAGRTRRFAVTLLAGSVLAAILSVFLPAASLVTIGLAIWVVILLRSPANSSVKGLLWTAFGVLALSLLVLLIGSIAVIGAVST
jgi:hypothetical protein